MEQLRKCMYCNSIGKFTCKMCGSGVCNDHFDAELEVCLSCKGKSVE